MEKLTAAIAAIPPLDAIARQQAEQRQSQLTKPAGSLGCLETLAIRVAGMTGCPRPRLRHKAVVTVAGDHGIAAAGVSAYPQEVTAQMVLNFLSDGAAINVLARHVGARVVIVDAGVACSLPPHERLRNRKIAPGTANMLEGPAMTRQQAVQAIETGIELVEEERRLGLDILCTGDMGIGNTTPSTAIASVITGRSVAELAGRGAGLDDAGLARKMRAIEQVLEVNHPNPADALDILARVGGFEIGVIAGLILGSAAHRVPVVVDGFISTAGALIACALAPQARDYCLAGHRSAEPGHNIMLDHLGFTPILDLNMRLGEGTGAVLAASIVDAACKALDEMATFDEAGVAGKG
jgi:nicotinate-nucleotide--dimethylbenzimidazole phosphoribosyltransferase